MQTLSAPLVTISLQVRLHNNAKLEIPKSLKAAFEVDGVLKQFGRALYPDFLQTGLPSQRQEGQFPKAAPEDERALRETQHRSISQI